MWLDPEEFAGAGVHEGVPMPTMGTELMVERVITSRRGRRIFIVCSWEVGGGMPRAFIILRYDFWSFGGGSVIPPVFLD